MSYTEWFWDGPEGEQIFSRSWSANSPRGQIVLIHGLAEHSGRYADLATYMRQYGWQVVALDLPGHGKTTGRAGHVRSWNSLVDTLESFVQRQQVSGLPLFLYGHSMGGALALQIALRKHQQIEGVIASAPPLRLSQVIPDWKRIAANFARPIFPWLRLDNGIDPGYLCRDPAVVQAYLDDPLVNSRLSLSLGQGLLDIGPWLLEHAEGLAIPALLMHGDTDQVTDNSGSREFCQGAGEICRYVEWPGFYHELHHEPGWRQVLATAAGWLDEQGLGVPSAGGVNVAS